MSESGRIAVRPLFGARPESFFGDKKEFCYVISSKLGLTGDPERVLKNYTKEAILQLAFNKLIGLDDLIPLPFELKSEEINSLITEEGVQSFGIDGELPPPEVVAQLLLRLKALDVVCGPIPEWTAEKRDFMNAMRGRLEKFLHRD